jgi:predicted nucleic acid-binding protein
LSSGERREGASTGESPGNSPEPPRPRIVVDTSVLFAATVRDASVRRVFMLHGLEWIAPAAARNEIRTHLRKIAQVAHSDEESISKLVEELLAKIVEVPLSREDPEMALARGLIGSRDASDVEFVAAAIKFHAIGIWSLDRDFDGIPGIPRFSTADVERLPEGPDKGHRGGRSAARFQ